MNMNGISSKITGILNNKTLQKGAGAYFHIAGQAAQSGLTSMQVLEAIVNGAITTPHIPNLQHVIDDLTGGMARPMLEQMLKLYLVGFGLETIGIGAKWGKIAQKFAKNAAIGVGVASVVTHATIWNSPGPDANSYAKVGGSTMTNLLNAPSTSNYGDY